MPLQEHEIPTVTILNDKSDRTKGISSSVIYEVKEDGTEDVFIDFSLYNIDNATLIDTLMEIITSAINVSYTDSEVEIIIDGLKALDKNTLVHILLVLKSLDSINLETELFINSYLQTVIEDTIISYRINIGTIPTTYDTDVDMYIWGTKFFNTKTDVFCAVEPYYPTLDVDVAQALGRLAQISTDIFSTVQKQSWYGADIFSSSMKEQTVNTELTTISGRMQPMETDVFSTKLGLEGAFPTDLKTRSLFTSDFFIEQDKFTTASSIAWVDVVDYLYPIDTDNTYLEVNGTLASGIWFEDIPNGKRLYYDPLDDFYSTGVLTYSLHAESIIGEVETKDFYLLYGYNLEPNEVFDWGPNKTVVVRVEAENLVFCPNKEGEAFDFITSDLTSMNLNCTIYPVGYVDLPVSIRPQSTVFYYGKTYTIKVKGIKDYAGNTMPDFEYTFTIEDPTA